MDALRSGCDTPIAWCGCIIHGPAAVRMWSISENCVALLGCTGEASWGSSRSKRAYLLPFDLFLGFGFVDVYAVLRFISLSYHSSKNVGYVKRSIHGFIIVAVKRFRFVILVRLKVLYIIIIRVITILLRPSPLV